MDKASKHHWIGGTKKPLTNAKGFLIQDAVIKKQVYQKRQLLVGPACCKL